MIEMIRVRCPIHVWNQKGDAEGGEPTPEHTLYSIISGLVIRLFLSVDSISMWNSEH